MSRRRPWRTHALVPDLQAQPGYSVAYCEWIGRYLAEKRPDVIVQIGDAYDMSSLCEYDRTAKVRDFALRSYQADLTAGDAAFSLLTRPLRKVRGYRPTLVYCLGNHEARYDRLIGADPRLEGTVRPPWAHAAALGWKVVDYLEPIVLDGIAYSHQFVKSSNGRVVSTKWGAPNARQQVLREMRSCTAGHKPGLDFHIQPAGDRSLYGLIAGSCYTHDEPFMGPQGNRYWRGIVLKHEVRDGHYDPMIVSLDYLRRRYG